MCLIKLICFKVVLWFYCGCIVVMCSVKLSWKFGFCMVRFWFVDERDRRNDMVIWMTVGMVVEVFMSLKWVAWAWNELIVSELLWYCVLVCDKFWWILEIIFWVILVCFLMYFFDFIFVVFELFFVYFWFVLIELLWNFIEFLLCFSWVGMLCFMVVC